MKIGIPREVHAGERRVAATPDTVKKLRKLGFDVIVESNAGAAASFPDTAYAEAGAAVVSSVEAVWQADVLLKVRPPELDARLGVSEVNRVRPGQVLISFVWPSKNEALLKELAAKGATLLAVDQIPRVTRAQKMDALSSMANIAGCDENARSPNPSIVVTPSTTTPSIVAPRAPGCCSSSAKKMP